MDRINAFLTSLGLDIASLVVGLISSIIAVLLADKTEKDKKKKLTRSGKAITAISGMFLAAYIGPLAVTYLGLPIKASAGITFLVGLFGMGAAEVIIREMPALLAKVRDKILGVGG